MTVEQEKILKKIFYTFWFGEEDTPYCSQLTCDILMNDPFQVCASCLIFTTKIGESKMLNTKLIKEFANKYPEVLL